MNKKNQLFLKNVFLEVQEMKDKLQITQTKMNLEKAFEEKLILNKFEKQFFLNLKNILNDRSVKINIAKEHDLDEQISWFLKINHSFKINKYTQNELKEIFENVFLKMKTKYSLYGEINPANNTYFTENSFNSFFTNLFALLSFRSYYSSGIKIKTSLNFLKRFLDEGERLWQKEQLTDGVQQKEYKVKAL